MAARRNVANNLHMVIECTHCHLSHWPEYTSYLAKKSIIQADFPNGLFRFEQSIPSLTEGLCVVLLVELFIAELKHGPEIASYWKPKLSKEAGKGTDRDRKGVRCNWQMLNRTPLGEKWWCCLTAQEGNQWTIDLCVSWWQQDTNGKMMYWHAHTCTCKLASWLHVSSRTSSFLYVQNQSCEQQRHSSNPKALIETFISSQPRHCSNQRPSLLLLTSPAASHCFYFGFHSFSFPSFLFPLCSCTHHSLSFHCFVL